MCADDAVRTASVGIIHNLYFNLRLSWFQHKTKLQHNKFNWMMKIMQKDTQLGIFYFFFKFFSSCENTTSLPGDAFTAWRFTGKVTLPKLLVVIWKKPSTPAVAKGTGTFWTREKLWIGFATQTATVLGSFPSFLGAASGRWPSRVSCKAHNFPSVAEMEKWLKRQELRLKRSMIWNRLLSSSFAFIFITLITGYTRKAWNLGQVL